MTRGKGVKLQNYRDGGLRDAMIFSSETGPEWTETGGRKRQWPDWQTYVGRRAAAGRMAPKGMKKLRG